MIVLSVRPDSKEKRRWAKATELTLPVGHFEVWSNAPVVASIISQWHHRCLSTREPLGENVTERTLLV